MVGWISSYQLKIFYEQLSFIAFACKQYFLIEKTLAINSQGF